MPDHPDETARAARPRDAWHADLLRAPPGDDRAAAPPRRALLDAGPIGTTRPALPEIAARREANTAPLPRTPALACMMRYRVGCELP